MVHSGAVSVISFPRERNMMSSTCVSSTVKSLFPGLTAELGIKSFCSHVMLKEKFPPSLVHSSLVFFFSHTDLSSPHVV